MGIPFGDGVMANEAAPAQNWPVAVEDAGSEKEGKASEKPIIKSEYPKNERCFF